MICISNLRLRPLPLRNQSSSSSSVTRNHIAFWLEMRARSAPRVALVVAHLSATTLPSCRTLFSSCYFSLHLCALGRESVMVCSFAISTARGILPLSGTMDLAPIRSYGATNATCPRGAQTPIISASGIPHGMHGKHLADVDVTGLPIVLMRNLPDMQSLCSVGALCRAHGSWNKLAHIIFIMVFMLQLYWQWPVITVWTLLSATRPIDLTHEMLQEKLKIVRAMYKHVKVRKGFARRQYWPLCS